MMTARIRIIGFITVIAAVTLGCGRSPPFETPASGAAATATDEHTKPSELTRVLDRVMASPAIHAEEGFTARLLVAPGEMYDPLSMRDQAGTVWINDDGGQEGDKGSRILALDPNGKVSTVVALGRLLPVTGFDIAPASFGRYRGQIFSLAQPEVTDSGAIKNHIVQRIDPMTEKEGSVFCTLPRAGTEGQGVAGYGIETLFGPEGSPFAGRFFAVTIMNNAVYQATPDGRCIPFVIFDQQKWGKPFGLTFSPDGQHMLVSTSNERQGAIARVRADGTIETEPLVRGEHLQLTAMSYAPNGFGDYAGELFVAAFRQEKVEMEMTHAPPSSGEVYRVTSEGTLKRVASGFRFPWGIHFVEHRLWVSDVNGDFITLHRELPDGFVVEITAAP
jgi:hypothetical protein